MSTTRLPITIYLLSLCNAFMYVCASLLITVSALIGFELAPNKNLATLPMAIQFFAIMCSTIPASYTMSRIGRKRGFLLAGGIGLVGACLALWGIFNQAAWQHFALAPLPPSPITTDSQQQKWSMSRSKRAPYPWLWPAVLSRHLLVLTSQTGVAVCSVSALPVLSQHSYSFTYCQ